MNFLDKTGLSHFWSKIKAYIASKKYIDSPDESIKHIVELTYEEYKALATVDPDTEYHIIESGSTGSIESVVRQLIQEADERRHPVGSLELNVSGTNPNSYLGFGTWELWGAGRVPVGVDTSQTEFNTVEKTGGEKTHTLVVDELPSHDHTIGAGNHKHTYTGYINVTATSSTTYQCIAHKRYAADGENTPPSMNSSGAHTHSVSKTGSGVAHNNIQPYITCYMWKRVL